MRQNREQRRKNAKAKARLNQGLRVHCQMCLDAALIAANDVFGCGPGRCEEFVVAYSRNFSAILDDFGTDADYAFADIDRRLAKICGEKFVPYKERYAHAR